MEERSMEERSIESKLNDSDTKSKLNDSDTKYRYDVPIQPRQLRLELTNNCNARCVFCHRAAMTRPIGYMSASLLRKCLADVRAFPHILEEIVPSNYGETFLHTQWFSLLQVIATQLPRTHLVIPTNGTLLTSDSIKQLSSIPTLWLMNFSVNAYFPDTYEFIHGLAAINIENIAARIGELRKLRPDVTVWVSMVHSPQLQTQLEMEEFKRKWSQVCNVQVNPAQYNNSTNKAPYRPVNIACRSLFSDMVVLWDGRVNSCCFDSDGQLTVGNVNATPLLDIWHSKEFTQLRKLHRLHNSSGRASISLCRSCTFA